MAEHKYTSLSDLLKDQSPKPKPKPKPSTVESEEFPLVTEMFGELYFRESKTPMSIGDLKFSPPLPLPKASSGKGVSEGTKDDVVPLPKASSGKGAGEGSKDDVVPLPKASSGKGVSESSNHQNKFKSPVKTSKSFKNDSCMYDNSGKLFPPPISTLRMSKHGKPFTYKRFDEEANAFVREEIKIDPRGVMAASRENGRLRIKFAQEEEKATEAVSDDDE